MGIAGPSLSPSERLLAERIFSRRSSAESLVLQVVFHAELTDGTRLSAMLTREIMPSANNSADGESEGPAMPIVLTKD